MKLAKLAMVRAGKKVVPVSEVRITTVEIGVFVTATLIAAITQTTESAIGIEGIRRAIAIPTAAPTKKSGKINPPRKPECSVNPIATILRSAIARSINTKLFTPY